MSKCDRKRVLFICGSMNQTTQMHKVAENLADCDRWFTPYYGGPHIPLLRALGLLESTVAGTKLRAICLDYLRAHDLPIALDGGAGRWDLVVTCSDLLVPFELYRTPIVLLQEGMVDRPNALFPIVRRIPHFVPRWISGTAATGLSDLYARFCVASDGFRDLFVERGADPAKIAVTGIPNFDDLRRFETNDLPHRGYALACTSDLRETLRRDDRPRFLRWAVDLARNRPLLVKLHPNERCDRALAEIARYAPSARVVDGPVEPLIANCSALVTQVSSVTMLGVLFGKETHSYLDLEEIRRLLPLQNGGRSAANVAAVCREVLGDARQLGPSAGMEVAA